MKRWIIRGFFIGLLVLCVGGWVRSYSVTTEMELVTRQREQLGPNLWLVQLFAGRIRVVFVEGWLGSYDRNSGAIVDYGDRYGMGFHARSDDVFEYSNTIPFSFPTAISAVLLWLVWRKTRAKVRGRAFPVELTGKGGKG